MLLVAIILASILSCYFLISYFTSKPFDYGLNIASINDIVIQGQTVDTNITVSYLTGTPQPVTLDLSGNSTIMEFKFSNITGVPKPNEPFASNLTIYFLSNTQPGKYPVNITSNSGTIAHSATYNLTVVSQIQVIGIVTTNSTDDIYPTKLQFISQQNNATYNATLSFASLPNNML
jgi:uncharacterized membrane protein